MVARFLSGYSIRGLLNYNEAKVESGDARLILANRFANEIDQLNVGQKLVRFEKLTSLNGMAKRNAIHIMLNFDRSDKLETEKLIGIATSYMKGVGFGEQPFLVYQHHDVSHPHVHIVSTNIRADGSRIDFHNIGKSISESVRKAIEIEFGLTQAQGRGIKLEEKIKPAKIKSVIYGKRPTKQSIYNVVTPVLRSYAFTSLAEFNAVLQQFNVLADRGNPDSIMFERRGLVYSVLDEKGNRVGVPIKASLLAGSPTLSRLEKKFASNILKRQAHKEPLKEMIEKVLNNKNPISKKFFAVELGNNGINVLYRRSEIGKIFGVTYVDHNTRCVFNGSDLGKAYSAKALLDRVSEPERNMNIAAPGLKNLRETNVINSNDGNLIVPLGKNSKEQGLMEMLLEKPAFDMAPVSLKRKKKKKQKRSQSFSVKT